MKVKRRPPPAARRADPCGAAFAVSDSRFRLLVENIGDVLWFKDLAPLSITYVSPAFEQIWGIPTDELYARPKLWEEHIHPEDRDAVTEAMKEWFEGRTTDCRIEYRVINRKGETRWLADHGIIIGSVDGRPYQISGIARDITASRADEAMRARLAAVVESSDDGIITLDLARVIQTWNSGAERIFGYTAAEAIGRPVAFLRPAEAADDEAVFLEHIRHGRPIHHYETKRRRKDGRIIDISLTLSPLHDGKGGITGYSKISRDITERKLAEQRFHDLLEAAPDALVITDRHGIIRVVNAQALRLFGYGREELVGRSADMLAPKGLRTRHARHRRDFLANPKERERFRGLELPGLRSDGGTFPMEINLSQIQTADGIYIISDIIDITERKNAEQAILRLNAELETRVEQRTAELRAANEELRSLIAMRRQLEEEILRISEHEKRRIGQDLHDDLGQQLAGAWMMSSVLERSLKKNSAVDAPAVREISRLLENALAQTRSLARGLHPVSPADGGLTSALKDLAARSTSMFGIQCQCRCRKEVNVDHETTATHLYRIAQEAVSNAVKHGRSARVLIQLSADAKGRITLVVRDHGHGLRPAVAGHQGMGLRIMRYRADMIGAELRLENESSGGARLTCILPAPIPPAKKTHAKKSRIPKSCPS